MIRYHGNLICLFSDYYRKGLFPICSLGPNWDITIVMIIFAASVTYFLVWRHFETDSNYIVFTLSMLLIIVNLGMMFAGILGDPGVDEKIHERLIKDESQ